MFQFIRRHQAIGLIFIGIVIVSFVIFFSPNQSANGGRMRAGALGSIYGRPIEFDEYRQAMNEARLAHWMREGTWPHSGARGWDGAQEAVNRLLLLEEAKRLGIVVTDDVAAARILELPFLRDPRTGAFNRAAYDQFLAEMRNEAGMTRADFEQFMRHFVALQHLVQVTGQSGSLVTPREAEARYRSGNDQYTGLLVTFAASNHLARVNLDPANISQFYSNRQAEYRIPERMQVRYVKFAATNFQAEADQQLAANTNLAAALDAEYQQRGAEAFRDAQGNVQTADAAKEEMKEQYRQSLALSAARKKANEFANRLYQMDPTAESLTKLATESGMEAMTSLPFDQFRPPFDLRVNANFNRQAFQLTADEPFATPFVGEDGVYLFAFERRIPSEIPPLKDIEARVIDSLRRTESRTLAESEGRDFAAKATEGLAQGKTFEAIATEAGLKAIAFTNLTRSSVSIPELGPRLTVSEILRVAKDVEPGKVGPFSPAADGGFVLMVESRSPLPDEEVKKELPTYLSQARQYGRYAAFMDWERKRVAAANVRIAGSEGESATNAPAAN